MCKYDSRYEVFQIIVHRGDTQWAGDTGNEHPWPAYRNLSSNKPAKGRPFHLELVVYRPLLLISFSSEIHPRCHCVQDRSSEKALSRSWTGPAIGPAACQEVKVGNHFKDFWKVCRMESQTNPWGKLEITTVVRTWLRYVLCPFTKHVSTRSTTTPSDGIHCFLLCR